jgi:hypothetical protein
MKSFNMEVSKKENGAYVKQGEVAVFYPLLNELGLAVESNGTDADGFPTYADEKVQYVFDAVFAAVKAAARNKLQSGTATLKEGATIASTVEELLATAERSGEALANRRDAIKAFVAFVPTTGKSAAVTAWVADQCKNVSGIQFQSQARKDLLLALVEAFVAALSAEQATKFSRFLTSLGEAASTAADLDDLPE